MSPAIGDLLSGSSPPLQFFNPVLLLLLVALYGCGALLVREAATWLALGTGNPHFLPYSDNSRHPVTPSPCHPVIS